MKALLVADLHLMAKPGWRLDWCNEFIDMLLAEESFADHELFLLGDVLEHRDFVDSRCLNMLIKLITKWPHDVYWVSGQHDSYVPGMATLRELQNLDNVIVVDNEVVQHRSEANHYFVPFARKDERYREMLATIPDGATIFTHLPLVEAIAQFGVPDRYGISQTEFDRFGAVYSGDIHTGHMFGKVLYIGAPSQRDWRDKHVRGAMATLVDGEINMLRVKHPIHLAIDKPEDLPEEDVKLILRGPADLELDDPRIVSYQAIPRVVLSHIQLAADTVNRGNEVTDYMKQNPPPDQDKAAEFARSVLDEVGNG